MLSKGFCRKTTNKPQLFISLRGKHLASGFDMLLAVGKGPITPITCLSIQGEWESGSIVAGAGDVGSDFSPNMLVVEVLPSVG